MARARLLAASFSQPEVFAIVFVARSTVTVRTSDRRPTEPLPTVRRTVFWPFGGIGLVISQRQSGYCCCTRAMTPFQPVALSLGAGTATGDFASARKCRPAKSRHHWSAD